MPLGPVTFNQGAWHFCQRCDIKTKLSVLVWQRGILLCPRCVDPWPLLGQREIAIAQVLSDGKVDFQVDPKLVTPTSDDDAIFS